MTTRVQYIPDTGVVFTIYGKDEGVTFIARDDMTLTFIEHRVRELVDFYG